MRLKLGGVDDGIHSAESVRFICVLFCAPSNNASRFCILSSLLGLASFVTPFSGTDCVVANNKIVKNISNFMFTADFFALNLAQSMARIELIS